MPQMVCTAEIILGPEIPPIPFRVPTPPNSGGDDTFSLDFGDSVNSQYLILLEDI
jgi:hypothetical protein